MPTKLQGLEELDELPKDSSDRAEVSDRIDELCQELEIFIELVSDFRNHLKGAL